MSRLKPLIHEIHRRSLWQVLAIYVVGSWLVLQVVDVLAQNMNLPPWTFPFALVLLLIGLPIVLGTAIVQEGVGRREDHATGELETTSGGTPIPLEPVQVEGARAFFTWRNALAGGVIAFALFGVAAAGWLVFAGGSAVAGSGAESESGDVIESIAVLPFSDMSPEGDQEYFSDGMSEEILDALAQVPGLRVAARSSSFQFKGESPDVREVGEKLGVNTVLEGSVRRDGDQIRITAQLISTEDGFHLWSESYERQLSSIFAIQKEIAAAIVEALRLRLPGGAETPLVKEHTSDLDAYDLYLQGRALVHQRGSALRRAIPLFEEVIERDSTYALAWAALAETYSLLPWYTTVADSATWDIALTRAEQAALVALELDPELAEAHLVLGNTLRDRRQWEAAEREYRLALELRTEYANAHQQFAEMLVASGRIEEALEEARLGAELDPLTAIRFNVLGYILRTNRRYDESIEALRHAESLDPDLRFVPYNLIRAYLLVGRYDEAERLVPRIPLADEVDREPILTMIRAIADSSLRDSALALRLSRPQPTLHALLGDKEGTLEDLERALFDPPFGTGNLVSDPEYDFIRDDPRFEALVKRYGADP